MAAEPARDAKPASQGSAPRKAAGSGGSSQAGNRGGAAIASASPGQQAKLVATWGARIRALVERRTRRTRGPGEVMLRVTVAHNGQLQNVSVRRSSGQQKPDAAAVAAVRRAGRFPAAPKGLTRPSYNFSLPVRFGR